MMASSSRDSGYVDNWQTGKTVAECNLHMLTTEDCSDVIFRVGSEKQLVRAHRYVLVSRSCVFHAMFCGPLAEKGEVTIPDIELDGFREFLRFIYTDKADIEGDNVIGLLYTSRKYAVDVLHNLCSTVLENSLSDENVCQILEQCHGYLEVDLEQKALKILTEADDKVINSPGFLELCSKCLEKFLSSDNLKLTEAKVFETTMSWLKERCLRDAIPLSHKNISTFLGDARYQIRFQSLSLEYIANVVGPSDILLESERIRIMDSILRRDINISPFNATQRKIHGCKYVQRFDRVSQEYVSSSGSRHIVFSCSKAIKLVGCQLYGPGIETEADYSISVRIADKDAVIAEPLQNKQIKLVGGEKLNDIMFPVPVCLDVNISYTLCVSFKGPDTSSGEGSCHTAYVGGVNFFFKDPRSTSQIPGLIFKDQQ